MDGWQRIKEPEGEAMNKAMWFLAGVMGVFLAASIVYAPDVKEWQNDFQGYSTAQVDLLKELELEGVK